MFFHKLFLTTVNIGQSQALDTATIQEALSIHSEKHLLNHGTKPWKELVNKYSINTFV